jgi:hypothetical protein
MWNWAMAPSPAMHISYLVLRGSRDYQTTEADFQPWRVTADAVAGPCAFELAGLNHLFLPGSGPPGPAEYRLAGNVSPTVTCESPPS